MILFYGLIVCISIGLVFFVHIQFVSLLWLFLGFIVLILLGHWSAFRQHEHGVVAQWTDPKNFFAMKLSKKEKIMLYTGLSFTLGGAFALCLQIFYIG